MDEPEMDRPVGRKDLEEPEIRLYGGERLSFLFPIFNLKDGAISGTKRGKRSKIR